MFAVVGPTASGKTALAIEIAINIGGEIVNFDSIQVYKGLDVATAKPTPQQRAFVPHHLIDIVSPEVSFNAGDWALRATSAIEDIEMRGGAAVLAGGSGLYLRALRFPFFPGPPTDLKLRARLTAIRKKRGSAWLYAMLRRLEPESSKRLEPRDWSRVQRALEVRLQTRASIVQLRGLDNGPSDINGRMVLLGLRPPRDELYRRIDERTELHFKSGLLHEVEYLLKSGTPPDSNALAAHGYRRVVEVLEGKRTDLRSAMEQTKVDIRRYAKRQLTWFRKEGDVQWFAGFGDDPEIKRKVLARISA